VTTHSASAARVLCRRSRPGDDEKQDGERTGNGVDHGSMPGGEWVDGCLTSICTSTQRSDRRDCQPEPGDGIDGAGRNYSRQPALDGDAPGRSCHL